MPISATAFLTRQGYTLVFVAGSSTSVARPRPTACGIDVPAAQGATGLVHGDFTPNDASPEQTVTDLGGYSPAQPDATDTTLTVRDGPFGRPEIINRNRFTREGEHRDADRRVHAGTDVPIVLSSREISRVRPRHGGVPRRGHVGEALARRPRPRTAERLRSARRRAAGSSGRSSTTASTATRRASRCSTA